MLIEIGKNEMNLSRKKTYVFQILLLLICSVSSATIFTVTTVADTGAGSLRQAIIDANANLGADEIHFNIPETDCDAAGVCDIVFNSPYSHITDEVTIDGSTQPRYGTAPANVCATTTDASYMRVQLMPNADIVFYLDSPEPTIIKGFSFGRDNKIYNGQSAFFASDAQHWMKCNHIGVNAEGTATTGLNRSVCIGCSPFGDNGIIGTNADGIDDIAERNVIAGKEYGINHNASDNYVIAGNYFGLTADGLTGLSTGTCVYLRQGNDNRYGSNLDGINDEVERNYFGACDIGIKVELRSHHSGDVISGNWFGLNAIGQDIAITTGINLTFSDGTTQITSNWINNAGTAIKIDDGEQITEGSTDNCITNSTVGVEHTGTSVNQPFINNYWGDATGPSGVGSGSGTSIVYTNTGTINYDPWNASFPTDCLANSPSVVLTKTAGIIDDIDNSNTISVGDVINYSFSIENTGNATLTDIIVSDPDATISGSPIASISVGATDTTSVTATHIITLAEYDSGMFSNQATVNTTAGGNVGIATDVSDDPTNNDNSTVACSGAATPCDPTVTVLKFPAYDSTPIDGSELVFGPISTGSVDPTASIEISNTGDPGTTLTGSCSISGSDATKFSITTDASFSLLTGTTDTETIACDTASAGVFHASLDCSHNGGNGPTASYPLICKATDLVDFISDGTAVFGYNSFITSNGAKANFSTTDDNLYAMWYWYRVSGDSVETDLSPPDSQTYVADTAILEWSDVNNNGLFDAQLVQVINQPITGTATLISTLKLTNISGSDVEIDLFNYFDFDAGGSDVLDEAVLTQEPNFITISDGSIVEQRAGGNNNYQVTEYSDIADFLNNAAINNLDNTGLPFGPQDFTGAFQWSAVIIPAGGSYTIETTSSIDTAAPVPNQPIVVINNAPNTSTDSYTLNEDSTLIADDADGSVNDANDDGVLVNDSDVESDTLTVVNPGAFTASGIGGSLIIAADGTFTYTPPADAFGQAGLIFDVTDGINTVSSSLSIDVVAVNDAPVTQTDTYTINEDETLTADDADGSVNDANDNGVFANDTDIESDTLNVLNPGTFTATGIGGSITIATNGTFVYIPPADAFGQAGLIFDVTDGTNTVSSSLSITVVAINDQPVTQPDTYTINEDETLTADDADGSVNGANDDGVLANDTDVESDPLTVVNPGAFTATGIGGSIAIAIDGTFVYTPPANVSGTAGLVFDVTDGVNVISSSLTINVLPVNDAPSFEVIGDIDATNQVGIGNTQIQIADFAGNIVFGPTDENSQNVQQFNLVVDDIESILNNINLNNNGTLDIDFSLNYGLALIDATLQDDGGTTNGGVDTSIVVEFIVAHFDLIFADGFETSGGLRLFDYLESVSTTYPHNNHPIYDFNNDSLTFYGHRLQLDNDYDRYKTMLLVKYWLQAVLIKEDSLGDYDLDGILNVDDEKPFEF